MAQPRPVAQFAAVMFGKWNWLLTLSGVALLAQAIFELFDPPRRATAVAFGGAFLLRSVASPNLPLWYCLLGTCIAVAQLFFAIRFEYTWPTAIILFAGFLYILKRPKETEAD